MDANYTGGRSAQLHMQGNAIMSKHSLGGVYILVPSFKLYDNVDTFYVVRFSVVYLYGIAPIL